jgi:two-component system chemotaxis response regulator CheY
MPPKISARKTSSPPKPWEGQRVLIVDDSPAVRAHLTKAYTSIGMQVCGTAANGVEALAQIESTHPDLVSLDIIMPEMDGIECYKKIQAQALGVKCVMISWIGGEPKTLESLAKIIPSHLFQAKPATAGDLASRLEKVYGVVAIDALLEKKINQINEATEENLDLEFSDLKVNIS